MEIFFVKLKEPVFSKVDFFVSVKQVFSEMDFLGWYTTGDSPSHSDIHVHRQVFIVILYISTAGYLHSYHFILTNLFLHYQTENHFKVSSNKRMKQKLFSVKWVMFLNTQNALAVFSCIVYLRFLVMYVNLKQFVPFNSSDSYKLQTDWNTFTFQICSINESPVLLKMNPMGRNQDVRC
jgi:hypothetical protein